MKILKKTIKANIDELDKFIMLFETYCDQNAINNTPRHEILIVLEELVTNSIKYSYPDNLEQGNITIHAEVQDRCVHLTITDDGIAFDPTVFATPSLDADLHSRPIGGLGLYLVSKLTNSVNYQRSFNQNQIKIIKTF